jgi:anti-sigma factor RsiW
MDCKQAAPSLSAWLDGELPAAAVAELEAHLGTCPACRRRRGELAAARHCFRQLAPERSRLQAADVLTRLTAEQRAAPPAGAAWEEPVRRWLPLAAAASLLAVALWQAGAREPARAKGSPAADAPRRTEAAMSRPFAEKPGLDCGAQNGEACRRLACFDAAECGGAGETWPPIKL